MALSLLFEDPRLVGLVSHVAGWTVVWVAVLFLVPPGASGRNHIVSLNAAHGVVCTLVAASTIHFALDTTNSTAASLAFFLVDLVAMVNADGISKLLSMNRSRQMDYVHHLLGIFWGSLFFIQEPTACGVALGNPYVWIQTNEISTPFYNWFRLTNSTIAGAMFATLFFLSRIVFNTVFLIPLALRECGGGYVAGTVPYFVLQYVWFFMIVRKMLRTTAKPRTDTKVE